MLRTWRLVDSGLVHPSESAALDEAILEAHVMRKVPSTLHFYIRSLPTISVGYFQKVSESVDRDECEKSGVAIIRRKSGGSSIFTDSGQLIYGLVTDESDLPDDRADSFKLTCSAIANALRAFGVDAVFRPANDVEVGGRKVSGSAQLRRKGSVLQHGTIVIETDLSLMDRVLKVSNARRGTVSCPSDRMTTLARILDKAPEMGSVKKALVTEFGKAYSACFSESSLSEVESSLVRDLVRERYSRKEWNLKF